MQSPSGKPGGLHDDCSIYLHPDSCILSAHFHSFLQVITVITSVYKKEVFENFKQNLHDTIGIPYELIAVDNSQGKMGLCEVYNKAAWQARFDILCFAHEDILITGDNWGAKIVQRFADYPNLGLLGIVGTLYKSYAENGWGVSWELSRANFVQHHKYSGAPAVATYENPLNEIISKVICVDGMWMCTPKKTALEIQFDEHTFRRFHCYDLDYSLSVLQKYDVAVTFDLKVDHFSEGSIDKSWITETIRFHKKWGSRFPIAFVPLTAEMQSVYERHALETFLENMRRFDFSFLSIMKVVHRNLGNPLFQKDAYARKLRLRLIKEYIKNHLLRFIRPLKKTA